MLQCKWETLQDTQQRETWNFRTTILLLFNFVASRDLIPILIWGNEYSFRWCMNVNYIWDSKKSRCRDQVFFWVWLLDPSSTQTEIGAFCFFPCQISTFCQILDLVPHLLQVRVPIGVEQITLPEKDLHLTWFRICSYSLFFQKLNLQKWPDSTMSDVGLSSNELVRRSFSSSQKLSRPYTSTCTKAPLFSVQVGKMGHIDFFMHSFSIFMMIYNCKFTTVNCKLWYTNCVLHIHSSLPRKLGYQY